MSNREILFRAKAANRIKGHGYRTSYKNGDWVYGLLTDIENYAGFAEMTNENGVSQIEVDKLTLGQFTGLTDINGTKIFEGDIVHLYVEKNDIRYPHIVDYNGLVVFKDGGFCVIDGVPENYSFRRYAFSNCGLNCKVIGNIHDNPELLEESEQE